MSKADTDRYVEEFNQAARQYERESLTGIENVYLRRESEVLERQVIATHRGRLRGWVRRHPTAVLRIVTWGGAAVVLWFAFLDDTAGPGSAVLLAAAALILIVVGTAEIEA